MPRIIAIEKLTATDIAYEIEAPDVASAAQPGHVVHVRVGEEEMFTPYAIADCDRDKGSITIIAGAVDHHATPWQSADSVPDGDLLPTVEVTGPVGRPGKRRGTKVLFAGEGAGVAALLPYLRDHKEEGIYTVVISAYATKDSIYWVDRFNEFSNELYVITADGSYGIKGPIHHTVKAVCETVPDIDHAMAVGPLGMMKACAKTTAKYGIPLRINLSTIIHDEEENDVEKRRLGEAMSRFGWENATDMNGHEVDFDDLTQKLGIQTAK
jgi:ferredoxin--NADP+ reductase